MEQQDLCERHGEQIATLQKSVHSIDLKLTKIDGVLEHLDERVNNGMSRTITTVAKDLKDLTNVIMSQIMPICQDSQYWVGKIKQAIYWIAVISVGGGFVGVLFYVIQYMLKDGLNG